METASIDWVEADGHYARIHARKQTQLVAQRMHALERVLDTARFIRIHRSLIVNGARVHELHREADGGGFIVLRDGLRLRVARNRRDAGARTRLGSRAARSSTSLVSKAVAISTVSVSGELAAIASRM